MSVLGVWSLTARGSSVALLMIECPWAPDGLYKMVGPWHVWGPYRDE